MYFYCFGWKEGVDRIVCKFNASTLLLTSVIDSNDDQLHFSKNSPIKGRRLNARMFS